MPCSYGFLNPIPYATQDQLLRGSTTYSELDIPTSIINQENAQQTGTNTYDGCSEVLPMHQSDIFS